MITPTPEQLSKIKYDELLIMKEIHRICSSNHISYSLFFGTLLGAIRHKGFIPWDDDIDIVMSVEDYVLFKENCTKSLSKDMFLQDNITEPNSCRPYTAKIRLNGTCLLENTNKNKNMHNGVWVDIFLYKKFDGNPKTIKKGQKLYKIFKTRRDALLLSHKSLKGKIASLEFLLFHPFSVNYYRNKYQRFLDKVEINGDKLLMPDCDPSLYSLDAALLTKTKLSTFEDTEFYIVSDYDIILTALYGNYMELPSADKQVSSHKFIRIKL